MPLFDASVPRRLLWPEDAPWPRRRSRDLIRRYEACFPDILYEVRPDVPAANAQAVLRGKARVVMLYGGLSRHRRIGAAGLSVALAHETGHHLGGAPYLRYYRWLSSEERATEWARDIAFPAIHAEKARTVWKRGLRELSGILPPGNGLLG